MKLLLTFSALCVFLSACGKSEDSSADSSGDGGSTSSGSKAAAGDNPWDDTSKPYLDDKKMDNFVASLKDKNGPFQGISKGVTAFNASSKMEEFDASARKHGFKSGEEYMGVWMRINSANVALMQQTSNESLIASQEESIRQMKEALKKPDVTAEMRQSMEANIKASEESISAMKAAKIEGVPEGDIEAFKKHRAEFEEAYKTWTK